MLELSKRLVAVFQQQLFYYDVSVVSQLLCFGLGPSRTFKQDSLRTNGHRFSLLDFCEINSIMLFHHVPHGLQKHKFEETTHIEQ